MERHRKDITHPGEIDEETDEFDLYYGEHAPAGLSAPLVKTPGPLHRRPSASSSIPFLILAALASAATHMHISGMLPEMFWASRETVFSAHEYWRLATALFVHADIVHLLSNMPLFFFFGLFLYEYFGFILFPVTSLLIGIAANAVTLYFYPEQVRLIGASGMVYGMVSLWLVLYVRHDTDYTAPMRIVRSFGFALVILFPTVYNPSTSYAVHAAGFIIGIISALLLLPLTKVRIPR